MADDSLGDKLRAMADHRGLKLVKSRRRKPGTGDYGKFGLTDMAGKPLLGIGEKELTASPEDIEDYLRAGATSTWKASADSTPERPASKKKPESVDQEEEDAPPAIRPRARRTSRTRAGKQDPVREKAASGRAVQASRTASRNLEVDEPVTSARRSRSAPPAPAPPEPELRIRAGKSADAAALAPLLAQLAHIDIDELAIARHLEAARKARGGMAVAEYGDLVGFCAWAVLHTVQHGAIGRITLLLVDERRRRRGVATGLLEAATTALRKAGCKRLEVMSDIEIANAHGFFRALKFEQTSYRFARDIALAD